MPPSIGVNLRVTGHSNQGGRKYMEDIFSVAYQTSPEQDDLEYAFFGIFDGHGGREAAQYARDHLMDFIVKQKLFWSDKDEDVLKAIKDGFLATHHAMWSVVETWPKTASGLPSTSGTTASVAFLRQGRIYIGHVGDSSIVLGISENKDDEWQGVALTSEHKPESEEESTRIHRDGGKVVTKLGIPRVVWNRPKPGHKGPVRRSTPFDEVPFLAVARALGDLWSHNQERDRFVVSPVPDVRVIPADPQRQRCLILGTDGLWNVISPQQAVQLVQRTEQYNESCYEENSHTAWVNPSHYLVERALEQWSSLKLRADNTSVVTLILDPPGPPKLCQMKNSMSSQSSKSDHREYPRVSTAEAGSVKEVASMLQAKGRVAAPETSAPSPTPSASPPQHLQDNSSACYPNPKACHSTTSSHPVSHTTRVQTRSKDAAQEEAKNKRRTATLPTSSSAKKRGVLSENRVSQEGTRLGSGRTSRLLQMVNPGRRELRSNTLPPRRRAKKV